MTLKLSSNFTRTSPLFIFWSTMSDLRRDPLYNTLNEFDFIVFVQLETELFHRDFQVNVPTVLYYSALSSD